MKNIASEMSADVVAEVKSDEGLQFDRLLTSIKRDFGPVVLAGFSDDSVTDIMLNPDGRVWFEQFGVGMFDTGVRIPSHTAEKLFQTIAHMLKQELGIHKQILEGELPGYGFRFEGLISPAVAAPVFAIRKKAKKVFTLEEYESSGMLSHKHDPKNQGGKKAVDFADAVRGKHHGEIIREAVRLKKNILVVGSTGSGKTTLINGILDAITRLTPGDRVVMIEDTLEVQCNTPNRVELRANIRCSMNDLLRATMRLRPTRICVGEVRGPEVIDLLSAWNTGHPGGVATIHADDALRGLSRIEHLIEEDSSKKANPQTIAEAINLVVFIDKDSAMEGGRKIRELLVVKGYDHINKRYDVELV